jgi:hypothetical protein
MNISAISDKYFKKSIHQDDDYLVIYLVIKRIVDQGKQTSFQDFERRSASSELIFIFQCLLLFHPKCVAHSPCAKHTHVP